MIQIKEKKTQIIIVVIIVIVVAIVIPVSLLLLVRNDNNNDKITEQAASSCCSLDYKNCIVSNNNNNDDLTCNNSKELCQRLCQGFWIIDNLTDSTTCASLDENCDNNNNIECCEYLICSTIEKKCIIIIQPQEDKVPSQQQPIFDSTMTSPTMNTESPSLSSLTNNVATFLPTSVMSETSTPYSSDYPSSSPYTTTLDTTMAPTIQPSVSSSSTTTTTTDLPSSLSIITDVPTTTTTQYPSSLPTGPFVQSGYSERIIIPQPTKPMYDDSIRTYCPHKENGLIPWESLHFNTNNNNNNNVIIPENTRVLISQSLPDDIGQINIPSTSELIVGGENNTEIMINVTGIIVQGNLTVGSETCRIVETETSLIVFTFRGVRPPDAVQNIPPPEVKGINVDGGRLSLHGKQYYRAWSRLSQTVQAGDRILILQDIVNWNIGQEIIIVTTAMKDSKEFHQNEIHIIEYIYDNDNTIPGTALLLQDPVKYRHIANNNYQGEVGLLTRTIKIQGSDTDSEPTDPDPLNCHGEISFYGDTSIPCPNTELTGYGAHIIIQNNGKAYIEGVEFLRVGQTNILGRYPIHFHLLNDECYDCYVKHSSFHKSYYRCITIHGTNSITISENVAYDIIGYCYYIEDGVEINNNILYNMAAHIHIIIGPHPPPTGRLGQITAIYNQSDALTNPADVTASGFYISNIHNNLIGNTASGGYSGFVFPILPKPIGNHKDVNMSPAAATTLTIDGNTAHSTAFWWIHAAGFYLGGTLIYDDDNGILTYNAGRGVGLYDYRESCRVNFCTINNNNNCFGYCEREDQIWNNITNTKTFLTAGAGLNSWYGRFNVIGFEAHDCGLGIEALQSGFWMDNMLITCRTGETITVPSNVNVTTIKGTGFQWYDTNQEHILTNVTFRNCGIRSTNFDQYDNSDTRGCSSTDTRTGCSVESTVFGFLGHSDTFNPEVMQATKNITYENCGRRYYIYDTHSSAETSTVSSRVQNWLDEDGSASGLNVPTIIGSGMVDCGLWWHVGDEVVEDIQGPLLFIPKEIDQSSHKRGIGHVHLEWDSAIHTQVDVTVCRNGIGAPCPTHGYIRHRGPRFVNNPGLPITANADIAGPVGGYGWYLELTNGAPKRMEFSLIEVDPDTPLYFSVAYPLGTSFIIKANANRCWVTEQYSCEHTFYAITSEQELNKSLGNAFYVSDDGILTFRIIQIPELFVGKPDWFLPTWDDLNRNERDGFALDRFEREGLLLPRYATGTFITVEATCAGDGAHCTGIRQTSSLSIDTTICPNGTTQISYDRCCNSTFCFLANGETIPT